MVEGLTPRAYRKEITKGVDELAERIKLVEDGRWCEEREPLLKAFASGLATEDEALQAERHISHCRSCTEFVGKLSGHLHDVGSAIFLPGALAGSDGHSAFLERVKGAVDEIRETALGPFTRPQASEGLSVATGARGGSAAGAGLVTKLTGLGSGAKAALACAGGAIAASACVTAGVGPISFEGPQIGLIHERQKRTPPIAQLDLHDPRPDAVLLDEPPTPEPPAAPAAPEEARSESEETVPVTQEPPLAPDTPPVTQELGVESAAQPVGAPPAQTDSGSGGGAVATEFGP